MTESDAELVARALAGDGRAYEKLVDRYRPAVYGLAYHRTRDPDEAEDIAQEAFVRAYVNLSKLRDPARFGAWLATITHNASSKRIAAKQRERREATSAPPPEDRRRTHVGDTVRQALSGLPCGPRLALILHCVDGYSHAEIASFLGVPRSAVSGRIYRAKQKLRRQMMELVTTSVQRDTPGKGLTEKVLAEIRSFVEMDFGSEEGPMHLSPHGERTSLIFPRPRRPGFEVQYTEYKPGHDWEVGPAEPALTQRHLAHDVVYVVLRGELRLRIGDTEKTVRTEESLYLPWGTAHAFLPVRVNGLTLMTIGICRPDEALLHYEAETQKRPDAPPAWEDLALACESIASAIRPDVLDRAIEAWEQWIELSKGDPDLTDRVAWRRGWVKSLRSVGVEIFD